MDRFEKVWKELMSYVDKVMQFIRDFFGILSKPEQKESK